MEDLHGASISEHRVSREDYSVLAEAIQKCLRVEHESTEARLCDVIRGRDACLKVREYFYDDVKPSNSCIRSDSRTWITARLHEAQRRHPAGQIYQHQVGSELEDDSAVDVDRLLKKY